MSLSTIVDNRIMESQILGLRCNECASGVVNDDMVTNLLCPTHGRFQQAVYGLHAVKQTVDRDSLHLLDRGMWRWGFLLPIRKSEMIVTLREGDTPLIHATRLGESLGLKHFYIKDESRNPTGSFKDRGASVTVSKCRELGIDRLILASSGNASSAFAAYCARASMSFLALVRQETSKVHRLQSRIYGNRILDVEGDMADHTALAEQVAGRFKFFHCAQPYNLYRAEGKKTLAFEISEALGWRVPDRILIPTSGGTNVLAIYQGYCELNALGWVKGMPAIDIVQATENHPIVRAWQTNRPVERWIESHTKSTGLGHPFPKAGNEVVSIMNRTAGIGWLAPDKLNFEASRLIAQTEGLFVQPASAAPVAGFISIGRERARAEYGSQLIVAIATGSGKNHVDEPLAEFEPIPRIQCSLDAVTNELSKLQNTKEFGRA